MPETITTATTGSPKTTLAGLVAAIGVALLAGGDYFDLASLKAIGGLVASVGSALVGMAARDHGVTSEQAGLKP